MIAALVTGARDLSPLMRTIVYEALEIAGAQIVIVGDCQSGADKYARAWCRTTGVACEMYVADWAAHGRAAGPKRNQVMVDRAVELGAIVLAFPRGGPGTADCMRRAERAGLRIESF
jgi:hypothetical protein